MSIFGTIRRLFSPPRPRATFGDARPIHGRYDAAQEGHNAQHWAAADALDADSANSLAVRQKLVQRSRYESGNNGHSKGVTLTQANYVVGRGPKLRMQTGSSGFNAMIEAAWNRWAKRVQLAKKLRTAVKAKVDDGEAFLHVRTNPALRDRVRLDIRGFETEQCTSPNLPFGEPGRIDGIVFDEFGNPVYYEVYKYHPGGQWGGWNNSLEQIPARFMLHLFREDRPGQHRGVPEKTPTLNLFAQSRRYREAVVAAAENIANFSILLKTQQTPDDGADLVRPLSSLPMDKGMMVAMPGGYDAFQPRAEQPAASYDTFTRSQLCEEARPLSMPYNIAAADSSGYSFSGGRLDHLTYFVSVDVEQADIEDMVLDPLFELWFQEAALAYGWSVPADIAPAHLWGWPASPQIDDQKTANARKVDLSCGVKSLRRIYAEDGLDLEEELQAMAEDYGISLDEMRARLLEVNLSRASTAATAKPKEDDEDDGPPPQANGRLVNRIPSANGNGRK